MKNYNPNTGLEYLRARYYNGNQGRFFQEDTYLGDLTDPLSLNRYAYTKNSPMNYRDPSGHVVITLGTVLLTAAIGAVVGMTVEVVHQVRTNDGKIETKDVVKASLIGATGGVIGVVTAGLVGAGFAAAGITGTVSATQAFAVGATTAATSGMAVRANTSVLEDALYPKNPDKVEIDWEKAFMEALDPGSVTLDARLGGIAGALWYQIQMAQAKSQATKCSVAEGAKHRNLIDGQLDDIDASVWKKGATVRGDLVDESEMIKNNLGHNFPVIDSFDPDARVIASNKSYDITSKTLSKASTWLSRMKRDIRSLAKFTSNRWNGVVISENDYDNKILNVEISEGHKNAILEARNYAAELGVDLKVYTTK